MNIRLMPKSDEVISNPDRLTNAHFWLIIGTYYQWTVSRQAVPAVVEMQKLTWQLQEGLVKFTGGSLVAAAGHPQALVDAVRLSLGLPLPFNHESSGDSGSETEQ